MGAGPDELDAEGQDQQGESQDGAQGDAPAAEVQAIAEIQQQHEDEPQRGRRQHFRVVPGQLLDAGKQEYANAVAAEKQAEADVAAGRAAVRTAEINLGYASVTAPISSVKSTVRVC